MTDPYAYIDDYLSGDLQGNERAQFEAALQRDPALAAEVALYRDMARALTPREEDALRVNLTRLGEQYTPVEVPAVSPRRWLLGLVVLVLLSVAGWRLWKTSLPAAPAESPARLQAPVTTDTLAVDPIMIPPQSPPPANDRQHPEKSRPIAADFQPNPRLEAMLNSQLRGEDYRFRVSRPVASAQLRRKGETVNFQLSGSLETPAATVKAPFRVLLFSNRPADFEKFQPVFSQALTFEKRGDAFQFRVQRSLSLPAGLYYLLIEDQDSGLPYFLRKVQVR